MQAALEDAIARVGGETLQLTVAGRTDAGVHARGQVASHRGAPLPTGALNAVLARDVRVLASIPAAPDFDARRDALSRGYSYRVLADDVMSPFEHGRALHWPHRLDRDALDACAAVLAGTHDFTAFTPTQTDHVRFERDILSARWVDAEASPAARSTVEFRIEADTFMRHMVRTLVGTMLAVGRGRMSVAEFERLLDGRPRVEAGDTAPPHALYLDFVRYPD